MRKKELVPDEKRAPIMSEDRRQQMADIQVVPVTRICEICLGVIEVMTFRGTRVCSELCRKRRDGELE